MSDFYSIKDMTVQDMDYAPIDHMHGLSLRERPLRARTAWLASPWKELGHYQSDHVDVLVGTQLDTHPDWFGGNESFDDREFVGRLGWRKWWGNYNGNPVTEYPGDVDLIDMGDYWQAKTRTADLGLDQGFSVAVEVWSTVKLKEGGTYRVTGEFTDIDWRASSDAALHQEEFHVYVIQAEKDYMAGVQRHAFSWVYNGGTDLEDFWSDKTAIHEMDWPRRPPVLPIDYTFNMDADLPYVNLLVRQMKKNASGGGKSAVTTANWKNFKVEKVS